MAKEVPDPAVGPRGDCAESRDSIAGFLDGGLERAADRRLRNHLVRCPECTALYRQTLAAAARMGRSLRVQKDERARATRSEGLRRRAMDATADGRRRNRFGLRLALLPAGIALLLCLFRAGGGEEALFVHAERGEVFVGDTVLDAERPTLRLGPGDWVQTGDDARAALAGHADRTPGAPDLGVLGARSDLLVLDAVRRELRLEGGLLELSGPASVQTVHGVLQLEGRARLEVSRERYVVECLEGGARWTGPTLVRELVAGERVDSSLAEDALVLAR